MLRGRFRGLVRWACGGKAHREIHGAHFTLYVEVTSASSVKGGTGQDVDSAKPPMSVIMLTAPKAKRVPLLVIHDLLSESV